MNYLSTVVIDVVLIGATVLEVVAVAVKMVSP